MAKGKRKLLYLAQIFSQETDDEHGLTLQEITDRLALRDISADRKTLYQDFEELRTFGLDIIAQQRGHYTYYSLGARDFELPELKLLVDSVQSARFITEKKSRELIRKLEGLVSRYQAQELHRQVLIAGRVKAMNESIYYTIDKLHSAINTDRQIRFQYCQWSVGRTMELKRGGALYQVSPWCLVWSDENYYLVAYDASEDRIKHYRVDKMLRLRSIEERRVGKERFQKFDMARYTQSLFGMYSGEIRSVTLTCENSLVGVIIDRFGKDIPLVRLDQDHFETYVNVAVSPQFFGWVMALGKGVRVTAPNDVVESMRDSLKELSQAYGE